MQLPAGIREKERYIIFKVVSEKEKILKEEILMAIIYAVHSFLGDKIMSDANIYLIDWNENIGAGILKTNHKTKDNVIVALSLLSSINEIKTSIIPLNTTGTIKKAKKIMKNFKEKFKNDI